MTAASRLVFFIGLIMLAASLPWGTFGARGAQAQAGCVDLLQNGGFEQGLAGWTVGATRLPAAVVASPVHSGKAAARLGSDTADINSYSSLRRTVVVPQGYASLVLEFYAWTWSGGASEPDRQEVDLLAPGGAVLAKLWRGLSDDRTWQQQQVPLAGYGGRSIVLYFNVLNDGRGGRAGMYLDDVHLWACSSATAAAVVSGTATSTPTRTANLAASAASATPVQSASTTVTPAPSASDIRQTTPRGPVAEWTPAIRVTGPVEQRPPTPTAVAALGTMATPSAGVQGGLFREQPASLSTVLLQSLPDMRLLAVFVGVIVAIMVVLWLLIRSIRHPNL